MLRLSDAPDVGFISPVPCVMFQLRQALGRGIGMVALRTERRAFMWKVTPRPVPIDSKQAVSLAEIVEVLEEEFMNGRARVYLGEGSRILEDGAPNRDEKSQIYIAQIKQDLTSNTVTLLVNRGDPEAVSQSFIDAKTKAVRIPQPKKTESPGWSAHLVISLKASDGYHRACFEKMPHVSSQLALSAIDKIVGRVAATRDKYTYVVEKKNGKKIEKEVRRYRPSLDTKRVPSENLIRDLEQGELTSITLTKKAAVYNGVGADKLIKKQEQKVVLKTAQADAGPAKTLIHSVAKWGKEHHYDAISFHLSNLPGGASNNPTIPLDDHDALEQLYVRAVRLDGFLGLLEGCYGDICHEIQAKMTAVVNGKDDW